MNIFYENSPLIRTQLDRECGTITLYFTRNHKGAECLFNILKEYLSASNGFVAVRPTKTKPGYIEFFAQQDHWLR